MGHFRVDGYVSGMHTRIVHEAECPEVAPVTCSEQPIPEHSHDQRITLLRLQGGLAAGLGKGFQLELTVPLDLKLLGIRYFLADGSDYDPPYAETHHRNETLFGPGDGSFWGRHVWSPGGMWSLAAGVGISLPWAKTEEDPFKLAEREEWHQHVQFGTGTFDPQAALGLVYAGPRWGMIANASGAFPFYANRKGYRAPIRFGGQLLGTVKPIAQLQIMAGLEYTHEEPEFWSGEPGLNSGRDALMGNVGLVLLVDPRVVPQLSARISIVQSSRGAQITQPVALTLGVSGWFQAKRRAEEPEGETP